jgi:hypothetical protein
MVVISELFRAAAATQSVAAFTLADSRALRAVAGAVEAIKITAIPRVAGRYMDMTHS